MFTTFVLPYFVYSPKIIVLITQFINSASHYHQFLHQTSGFKNVSDINSDKSDDLRTKMIEYIYINRLIPRNYFFSIE